ncbi:hypothetical protein SLEP1_g15877 [Rubroshorea leprosula]|uniref:Uncharacterized protein n=1 Tax=Rubroshorea leprosula TaxID=152421 RepID=A0AAV5INW1_9ROSI|nr:hypothetical protein SLEP1_g15877 [Rubroshorea leprosula]
MEMFRTNSSVMEMLASLLVFSLWISRVYSLLLIIRLLVGAVMEMLTCSLMLSLWSLLVFSPWLWRRFLEMMPWVMRWAILTLIIRLLVGAVMEMMLTSLLILSLWSLLVFSPWWWRKFLVEISFRCRTGTWRLANARMPH